MLDELCAAGDVLWAGHGSLPGSDGWVSLHLADSAPLTASRGPGRRQHDPAARAGPRGARRRRRLLLPAALRRDRLHRRPRRWSRPSGTWCGPATSPTTRCAPVRTLIGAGGSAPRQAGRHPAAATAGPDRRCRPAAGRRPWPGAGRCCRHARPTPPAGPTRSPRRCSTGTVWSSEAASCPSGHRAASPPSTACWRRSRRRGAVAAATSSRGSALRSSRCPARSTGCGRWPLRPSATTVRSWAPVRCCWQPPTRPTRSAPHCRGPVAARTAATSPAARPARWSCSSTAAWCSTSSEAGAPCSPGPTSPHLLQPAVDALALAVREGHLGKITVERADGAGVLDSTLGSALESAGFHATSRGLRLRR